LLRRLVGFRTKLWAVVKSNAYGHGIFVFSAVANKLGVDGFCVDSLIEGVKLRREGIKKPILVLGPTLPNLFSEARKHDVALTISNFESLGALVKTSRPPQFHLKFDTGMRRQGFYPDDTPGVLGVLLSHNHGLHKSLRGICTHFAGANDFAHRGFTEKQFQKFLVVARAFEAAGFKKLIRHCAATGGAMLDARYHLDAVRIGIGLYGLWPSEEFKRKFSKKVPLRPILSWRTVVTEVKALGRGDYVGYDLTERVRRRTTMAVIPLGYWHGLPRSLSSRGTVLVRGREAKVLGRVSMDLAAVDIGGLRVKVGDVATLIGRDGKRELRADRVAQAAGTTAYELLTRLNPLMERVIL